MPTITEMRRGYLQGTLSPVEVVRTALGAIAQNNLVSSAFTEVVAERALDEARAAERLYGDHRADGQPLLGIPLAVKDVFDTAGIRTSYGSAIFKEHVPTTDALAVEAAKRAGAIVIGKTATHEFAWGITSVNANLGTTRNPWNTDHISGGSSGGSAVAVATGTTPIALGTDTAGSVRIPAAFCGVVGFKPTYGRVSRFGVMPLAPSFDHVGVLATDPSDAALLLSIIEGRDVRDPATVVNARSESTLPRKGGGFRFAFWEHDGPAPMYAAGEQALSDAARSLEALGHRLVEVRLPSSSEIRDAFQIVQAVEGLDVHQRHDLYPRLLESYGPDLQRRLSDASDISFNDYLAAVRSCLVARAEVLDSFDRVDFLVSLVSPIPPPRLLDVIAGEDETFRAAVLPYTVPQCVIGVPTCTVRAGLDGAQLPIGMQVSSRPWTDISTLRITDDLFATTPKIQVAEASNLTSQAVH